MSCNTISRAADRSGGVTEMKDSWSGAMTTSTLLRGPSVTHSEMDCVSKLIPSYQYGRQNLYREENRIIANCNTFYDKTPYFFRGTVPSNPWQNSSHTDSCTFVQTGKLSAFPRGLCVRNSWHHLKHDFNTVYKVINLKLPMCHHLAFSGPLPSYPNVL